MTTLNKNYTRIEGTDAVNTIDETNDTQLGEIEVDMGTLETDVTANEQATALNTTHRGLTNNPHTVTAAQVGKDTAQWNANEIQGIEVDTTGIADTNVLKYDSASGKLIAGAASVVADLNDLDDVVSPTPTTGDVLTFDGTNWVNDGFGGTAVVSNEVPTEVPNGTITNFSTTFTFVAEKIAVYINRTRLKLDEDYTEDVDRNGVTLTVAPLAGDDLIFDYLRSDNVLIGSPSYQRINETPTGLVNSSNTVYDTAETFIAGSLQVFLNGQLLTITEDYTETDSNTFTMVTAPATGDILRITYQTALTPAGNADTLDNQHGDYYAIASELALGWISANETWTYSSVDDPTGIITISGDKTTKYSAGMRIKFVNGGNTICGIITVVAYSSPNTIITFLHEIDPTDSLALVLMANSAITVPYYSTQKAPFGFPLSPAKWTVEVTDVTLRSQLNPTVNVWNNLGSLNIVIPIGNWDVIYSCDVQWNGSATGTYQDSTVTLSTANNSQSDVDFSGHITTMQLTGLLTSSSCLINRRKTISLESKTTYYLNTIITNNTTGTLYNRNDLSKLIIRAVCAYL